MMENSDRTMTETSNSGVLVNRSSFRPITNSYQGKYLLLSPVLVPLALSMLTYFIIVFGAEKLREAWPIVKSLLEELGHSCSMDTVCENLDN